MYVALWEIKSLILNKIQKKHTEPIVTKGRIGFGKNLVHDCILKMKIEDTYLSGKKHGGLQQQYEEVFE
jgi:hypothetical protein